MRNLWDSTILSTQRDEEFNKRLHVLTMLCSELQPEEARKIFNERLSDAIDLSGTHITCSYNQVSSLCDKAEPRMQSSLDVKAITVYEGAAIEKMIGVPTALVVAPVILSKGLIPPGVWLIGDEKLRGRFKHELRRGNLHTKATDTDGWVYDRPLLDSLNLSDVQEVISTLPDQLPWYQKLFIFTNGRPYLRRSFRGF